MSESLKKQLVSAIHTLVATFLSTFVALIVTFPTETFLDGSWRALVLAAGTTALRAGIKAIFQQNIEAKV